MKSIRVRLPSDLSLRLLALLLAVALWFVAAEGRTTTPVGAQEERVVTVPVLLVGVKEGLVITSAPDPVSVRLRLPLGSSLDGVEARIAAVDFPAGNHQGKVDVTAPPRIFIVDVQPSYASFRLEAIRSQVFLVEVAVANLPLASEVEIQEIDPEQVAVTGPDSRLKTVVRVQATVVFQPDQQEQLVTLKAVDANGREVEGIEIIPAQVNVVFAVPPLEAES